MRSLRDVFVIRKTPEHDLDRVRAFVYGTLKKGFFNHAFLDSASFVHSTRTRDAAFTMISIADMYPGVHEGSCQILGEVYEVSGELLYELDLLESNGHFYKRRLVHVEGVEEPVWMYCLLSEHVSMGIPNSKKIITDKNAQEWIESH